MSTETARRPRASKQTTAAKAKAGPGGRVTIDDKDPMQALLAAMHAVRSGDFSVQLPLHWDGLHGKLAENFNTIVDHNRRLAEELARVGQKVGREGQTRQRVAPASRQGTWADMEQSVNHLIDDLVRPVETMTEAIAGVAKGDLTRTVPLEGSRACLSVPSAGHSWEQVIVTLA